VRSGWVARRGPRKAASLIRSQAIALAVAAIFLIGLGRPASVRW
jgi:hypothetical protein